MLRVEYETVSFANLLILYLISFCALIGVGSTQAQQVSKKAASQLGYKAPSEPIYKAATQPPPPRYIVGPQNRNFLEVVQQDAPSLKDLVRPTLRLAGVEISTELYASPRTDFGIDLKLIEVATGVARQVTNLPSNPRIGDIVFSPNERWIALTLWEEDGIKLWLIDVKAGAAKRLINQRLNCVVTTGFSWLGGSDGLLVSLVPAQQKSRDSETSSGLEPSISEADGKSTRVVRTFSDFLKNSDDENSLDQYLIRQLAKVSVNGRVINIGTPSAYLGVVASPDGQYLLASRLVRPYPKTVTVDRFPQTFEVLSIRGTVLTNLHTSPAWEQKKSGANVVQSGRRDWGWRSDSPSTLFWVEALDGGDPAMQAEYRDSIRVLTPPFTQLPTELVKLRGRFKRAHWGTDQLMLIHVAVVGKSEDQLLQMAPNNVSAGPSVAFKWNPELRTDSPGRPLQYSSLTGESLLQTGKRSRTIFLERFERGTGGDLFSLVSHDLESGVSNVVWRSNPARQERVVSLLQEDQSTLIFRSEDTKEPQNLYVQPPLQPARKLTTALGPQTNSIPNTTSIEYRRKDGTLLRAQLHLPANFQPERDGRIPLLVWIYPREFASKASASSVPNIPNRFVRPSPMTPRIWTSVGYAVLEPTIPILSENGAPPNDTFLQQLVDSAEASVDEVVKRGFADPGRVAVAGHSYGAFAAANLLVHTKLFSAGIALSGAYDRTLTPFGFQSESRSFWQAPEVYRSISPFQSADKINAPLLLIHGSADSNPGATPQQSERMFQALRSLGKVSRLVLLLGEDHQYRARESILHVLWEQENWLGRFLSAAPR